MKSVSSKIIVVLLMLSFVFASASCSSANKEEIFTAVTKFSKAMADRSLRNLKKVTAGMDDEYELDYNHIIEASDEDQKVIKAIGNRIRYTIDEDSLDVSKNGEEATVDVLFDIVNWEDIKKDDKANIDTNSFIEAVEESDDFIQVLETLELAKDHGEWVVTNYDEVFRDFYGHWVNCTAPIDYVHFVYSAKWYGATSEENGFILYNRAKKIELSLMIDFRYSQTPVYYTVSYQDKVIYTSGVSVKSEKAVFDVDTKGAPVTSDGFLQEGEYTITFYTKDKVEFYSDKCTVTEGEIIPNTSGISSEAVIYAPDKVSRIKWFFSSGEREEIVYNNAKSINLDMTLKPDYSSLECRYEVLYEGNVIYTSETAKGLTEGFYRSTYEGAPVDEDGNLAKGVYTIIFYDADGNKLASDSCKVE